MYTRTSILERHTPLAAALPAAQFAELHARMIDAPQDDVWAALHSLTWNDLWLTKPLLALRFGGSPSRLKYRLVDPPSPFAPLVEQPPEFAMSAMIMQPWRPRPVSRPAVSVDELRTFDEPGWLKCGVEWVLAPLPGDRTFVETATICETTDARARRRFGAYWMLIRAFSGVIRREVLAALARRSAAAP